VFKRDYSIKMSEESAETPVPIIQGDIVTLLHVHEKKSMNNDECV
jgi:hypothetical protein